MTAHRRSAFTASVAAAALLGACAGGEAGPPRTDEVFLTWIRNTTWLVEIGESRLFLDAAMTRLRGTAPPSLSDPETLTPPPAAPDTALVRRVLSALGADGEAASIVVGHTHSDHTMDLGPIAKMTGASIVGSRTACLQARAQGVQPELCTAVEGGEVLTLLPGLDVRVIRWAHSGNPADRFGRLLQAPKELIDLPFVDPETRAMFPGPFGAFPNGGGARAYLFTYDAPSGPIRWLFSDTGNPFTFDGVVGIDPDYLADVGLSLDMLDLSVAEGSPREWLASGVEAEGTSEVGLWLAFGGRADHLRQIHEHVRPAAVIPHHWGGLFGDYASGVPRAYGNVDVAQYLDSAGVAFLPQLQYLERYRLTAAGVERVANPAARAATGLPEAPSEVGPGA